jgi:predicted O-methyltransferase YrrM
MDGVDFYGPAVIGAATIGALAIDLGCVTALAAEVLKRDPDQYAKYVADFVSAGQAAPGWRYADIVSVLAAATELLRPHSYLEIGVRRGRSMCVVASRARACAIIGVDYWNAGYAGIDNPGPDHVRGKLASVGHTGEVELISGDSHDVLPRLFRERPGLDFDLITVDGDHSAKGARRDLLDVLPRLRIGGAIVFDDISHPAHEELSGVWERAVAAHRRYATWSFDDVGYGVAVAVRRW